MDWVQLGLLIAIIVVLVVHGIYEMWKGGQDDDEK